MLPTNDLHRKIKILKIKDNYKVNILNFVNNCLQKRCPDYFQDYFRYKSTSYGLRNRQLDRKIYKTETGYRNSKKNKGTEFWNT